MTIRQKANEGVLRFLQQRPQAKEGVEIRRPGDRGHDYEQSGAHPEVVERLWDQLGKRLPADCRTVLLGTPALVHPGSGVVLAVAVGTEYGVRLPRSAWRGTWPWQVKLPPGARIEAAWTGGGRMDIQRELGKGWIFGAWSSDEEAWCEQTFRECSAPADNPPLQRT